MYLLDTDVLIDFFRDDKKVVANMRKISNCSIFVSSLSLCELYKGAFLSDQPVVEQEKVSTLVSGVELAALDRPACSIFGRNYAYLKGEGKPTQEFDLLVASIAISRNLTLITRNKKHFQDIPGLKFLVW